MQDRCRVCETSGGRRQFARVLTSVFLIVLIAFACVILFICARQRRMYYQPKRKRSGPTPSNIGIRHWNVLIDGRIDSWWIPASPGMATVLVCHGNAGNISHRLPLIAILKRAGFGLLVFDYSGYGNTPGRPTESNLRFDAAVVYKWLCKRVGGDKIIVLGQSLGGGVACDLVHEIIHARDSSADQKDTHQSKQVYHTLKSCALPRGMVLDSTFTSMPDACEHQIRLRVPLMSWMKWLVVDKYDTINKIQQVSKRVVTVIMHTPADRIIPFDHAIRNARAASCPLVAMPRGGHNDGYMRNTKLYTETLGAF